MGQLEKPLIASASYCVLVVEFVAPDGPLGHDIPGPPLLCLQPVKRLCTEAVWAYGFSYWDHTQCCILFVLDGAARLGRPRCPKV